MWPARLIELFEFQIAHERHGTANANDIAAAILEFYHQIFNLAIVNGTHNFYVQRIKNARRRIEKRSGIMIAAHDNHIGTASIQERCQKTVILRLCNVRRIHHIKDIARNDKGLRTGRFNFTLQPIKKCARFFCAVNVMHRIAKMPVCGMDKFHVKTPLLKTKILF